MDILLIEDDITLNSTIADFLKYKGNEIQTFEDGLKAIETIDKTNFDLYIIDINIPHINGLEIVKYIRQKDTTTPIIMITASMELENFKRAYKNGCDDYIKKPFYLEELDIRIEKKFLVESFYIDKNKPTFSIYASKAIPNLEKKDHLFNSSFYTFSK